MGLYTGMSTCRASNAAQSNDLNARVTTYFGHADPGSGGSLNGQGSQFFEFQANKTVKLYWAVRTQLGGSVTWTATNAYVAIYREADPSNSTSSGPQGSPVQSTQVLTNATITGSGLTSGSVTFTPTLTGTYRILIWITSTQSVAKTVWMDSDGHYGTSGTAETWLGSIASADQGFIRFGTTLSADTISNVSAGGAVPATWTYPDNVFGQVTFADDANSTDQSNGFTLTTKSGGTRTATLARSAAGVWGNAAGIGPLDKTDLTSPSSTYLGSLAPTVVTNNGNDLSIPWMHLALTTADSSSNGCTGYVVGAAGLPTIVASPFGANYTNAMSFAGSNQGSWSNGVDCGSHDNGGPPGVTTSFCLEAKIKPSSTTAQMAIAGRYVNSGFSGGAQPTMWVQSNGSILGSFRNGSGTYNTIVSGAGTIVAGNTYDVAFTSDGTTARLFINGTVQSNLSAGTVEADGGYARFMIGRDDDDNPGGTNEYPFHGVIAEVRWSNIQRYSANYTPATSPLTSDANTLGLWHLTNISGLPAGVTAIDPSNVNTGGSCYGFTMAAQTLDVGVRFDGWMQLNDNTLPPAGYSGTTKPLTPPATDNTHGVVQRLTSDLAFVGNYCANARTEALGGVVYTRHFQDLKHLVADVAGDSVTTTNAGAGTGFAPSYTNWVASLPGGEWDWTATITSPSGLVGCEVGLPIKYTLLAKNPNYNLLTGLGPTSTAASGTHPVIGEDVMAGFDLLDFSTNLTIPPDPGSMYVMLGRFDLTLGRAEYLNSDGTWQPVATLQTAETITAATNATPIQLTVTAHGYSTGDVVFIAGVGGNTAANGEWMINKVDANNFTLNNSVGNGTYTSGGTSQKLTRNAIYRWPCMRGTEIPNPFTLPDPSSYIIVFPGSASSPWAGITWTNDNASIVVPSAGYTQNWIYSSIFVEASCTVNGTPYFGSSSTPILGSHNSHGGAPFSLKLGPLVPRA